MLICLMFYVIAVLPTVYLQEVTGSSLPVTKSTETTGQVPSTANLRQTQYDALNTVVRETRNGRDFDTLLGRSFGTSKRSEFDEIDSAGFKDYLYKRNFDEIDNAGFKDHFYKRNFDEIDNAGFKDYLYKRDFDEIDNAGFKDYLYKRNFDEIDNAGFKDHLYKRNFDEIDSGGFKDDLYKRRYETGWNYPKNMVDDGRQFHGRKMKGMFYGPGRRFHEKSFLLADEPNWKIDEVDSDGVNEFLAKMLSGTDRFSPNDDGSDNPLRFYVSKNFPRMKNKRNFDEIDRAGFDNYFYKRSSFEQSPRRGFEDGVDGRREGVRGEGNHANVYEYSPMRGSPPETIDEESLLTLLRNYMKMKILEKKQNKANSSNPTYCAENKMASRLHSKINEH